MTSYRAILLASLLLAPPLVGGETGTVKGTFTVAGKTFTPDNVYAVLAPGSFDKSTRDVHVIFSVKPREKDLLLAFGHGGSMGTDLTVVLGEGPKSRPGLTMIMFMCRVKGASMREDEYYSKNDIDIAVFGKKAFDPGKNGRVAGTIRFSKESLDSDRKRLLTSDIEFDVPILGEMTK